MAFRAILIALAAAIVPAGAQQTQPATASGMEPTMSALDDVRSVTPALATYTDQVLMGDLWKRTDLTPRDVHELQLALKRS